MPDPESKPCSKCGLEKPLTEYYKHPSCLHGRHSICKVCMRLACKERREELQDERRQYDRERYSNNAVRRAAVKQAARNSYVANVEAKRQYQRDYYRANPEVYERGRAKRNARKRAVEHEPYTRREIYDRDGGQCKRCRTPLVFEPNGFQIDHIIPISLGGPDTPTNVQLMCPPCNREKWANLDGQLYFAA